MSDVADTEEKNRELRAKLDAVTARRKRLKALGDRQSQLSLELEMERNIELMDQERALLDFRSALAANMSSEKLLDVVMQWNALNDCFFISHGGPFATINGLRLGLESVPMDQPMEPAVLSSNSATPETRRYFNFTSPSPPHAPSATPPIRVPWTEINAALGQVALLLSTLEKFPHCGIRYRHQLVHQGSTAKVGIRRAGSVSLYNLYHDDTFQLFGRRNFNIAIECLCDCVIDAAEALQARDRAMTLPYTLERVKGELRIGQLPTSIAFGQDGTEWTRAMKYLLTDLKHIMTFRLFLGSNSSG